MSDLYWRKTCRLTGLAVDIFKPVDGDGEFYYLAKDLGVRFLFQCTVHKTVVGSNDLMIPIRGHRNPTTWCKGCAIEAERVLQMRGLTDKDASLTMKDIVEKSSFHRRSKVQSVNVFTSDGEKVKPIDPETLPDRKINPEDPFPTTKAKRRIKKLLLKKDP